jgi:hypothetical protein
MFYIYFYPLSFSPKGERFGLLPPWGKPGRGFDALKYLKKLFLIRDTHFKYYGKKKRLY